MKSGLLSVIAVAMMTTAAAAESQMWVTGDRANRRTCASTECGIVGKLFFRESAKVVEIKTGWARVSKYYDASCVGGRSKYVDAGRADCVPENGIVDGQFAEWIKLDLLSESRPADPGVGASGTAKLGAQSDDFRRYEAQFVTAAESLMASGTCSSSDFTAFGGWAKSWNKGAGIYFMYCGGMTESSRIYLDVATGTTFR